MIEHHMMNNGIEVAARYSERAVNEIFLPLLNRLTEMRRRKGRRILAMVAAPPGTGKTTLLDLLQQLSREKPELERVQAIGMDGFHRRQEELQNLMTVRDGRQVSMVEVKGAPETFDLELLTAAIRRIAAGENAGWPVYNRMLHNPVADAVRVEGGIVLLEGNYLLLDEDGWRDLSACADYTVSICAEESLLRTRLIDRRIRTGVERSEAIRFVDFSDMPNVRLCLRKTMPADLQLRIDAKGDYFAADGHGP